ncbi:HAMP domain-containing histidine kinase [Brevundimonas sp. BAL450]|uniref:histidine kinase n=2 Tax=Brevundimonas TaxID=41275 RepID=A0A8E0KLJ4_9CAUL|nr:MULTISPECIES: HAMP domain-containing sensor histidine kinase [Brevundimonas]MBG7615908.1 HAMP domain-containing histidine kinase [Brevundimonas sp. BAL450]GAD58809.1 sensor histidine kinase [Brevundimonas abyssalis TAR-001]
MKRAYRLDVRLAIVVTVMSALTLILAGTILTLEFTRGQFAIEERGLSTQIREWAPSVRRGPDGTVAFVHPPEPSSEIDPPYTGLLTGDRPVYGYTLVDADGTVLDRSESRAPSGRPGAAGSDVVLSSGPALDGSGPLLIAELYVPEAGVWFRLARARADVSALASTFFAESLAELGWAAVAMSLVLVMTAVVIVRFSLHDLRRVAAQAGRITFDTLGHERLVGASAPAEVQPLIHAVNQALDSIEAGAAAQRDFSIHAAHELRTPLSDLRLRLESLPHDHDRDAAMRDVDAMARLIEQLLNIARLDGGAAFAPAPLDLAETVAQVLREAAPRLVSAGWSLEADGLDTPTEVIGDPTLIALVIRNLLDNVRKHTPAGTRVSVVVSADGSVLLRDTGPGLPRSFPDSGFSRFVRGTGDSRSGSGLGLAICESAMRRMGGDFILERADRRKGAAFRMMFKPTGPTPSS